MLCDTCGRKKAAVFYHENIGGAVCYTVFAAELAPLLPTFGGRLCHAGAVPAGYRARQERAERAAALRQELAAAVEAERFEDAAALRDRIRELEQEAR